MSSSADRPGLGNSNDDTGLSAEQFQMLVDGVIEYSIYMLSSQGLVSSWNNGAKRIKGYDSAEIVGQHFSRFFTPEDQLAGKPNDALATATAVGRFEAEGIRVRKDGSHFWAHVVMDAITDDDRNIIGFAKITRDITRQKEDADRIQNVTRTLNLALANIVQGLCLFDAAGNLMISNQQTNEIFGVGANATLPGTPFSDLIATLVARSSQPDELSAQTEAQHIVRRHQDLIRRGERRTVLENVRSSRTVSIMHRGLADGGWLTTFEDVTERRRAELKIAHMAHHDGLTGLPNRLNFNEYLKEELRKADRGQQQVGIICIDLGSGLIDQSQKMTAAAMQIADMKVWAQRS
ncbi:PAS-domain containing protein [Acidisoma cladoniae]|uniref:PAS-domain containing protein n=1 Tax=Acidisoma cladoniae TaxID=3040935 RepID=UPI0025514F03|nr:PAS-domain containing protein [Acidisoma sp. PAMC 29798]